MFSPTITLSVSHAPAGDFTVTGAGFPPGELVGLYWDTGQYYCGTPGPNADAQGGFSVHCIISLTFNPGTHLLCADSGPLSTEDQPIKVIACAQLVIDPEPGSSPTPAPVIATPSLASNVQAQPPASGLWLVAFLFILAVAFGALTYWLRRQDRGI